MVCHHIDWDGLQILIDATQGHENLTYKCLLCDTIFNQEEYKDIKVRVITRENWIKSKVIKSTDKEKEITRLDVRDNELYKLILNQSNKRESLLYSCKGVFQDLIDFNFSEKRKEEIINLQIKLIEKLLNDQSKEINNVDLSLL